MEFNGNLLCPFVPPQSRENIRSAGHFTEISGDAEDWLLRVHWSLLLSTQPRLSEKVSISTALFFPLFPSVLVNVLPS